MPTGQPYAFGPAVVNPPVPGPAAPAETSQQPPATTTQSESGSPQFDLGFDPAAKESLPFEIPDQSEAETGQAAPFAAAPLPAPSFYAPLLPTPSFPGETLPETTPPAPAPTFAPSAGGQDFLQSAPGYQFAGFESTTPDPAVSPTAARRPPPKVLHIRCPSGHLVKARSDLLGKNGRCPACKTTFELRYEDSIEFQRRTGKILHRDETKTGRAWIAWAFLAAFIVFAGLVALMLWLSS